MDQLTTINPMIFKDAESLGRLYRIVADQFKKYNFENPMIEARALTAWGTRYSFEAIILSPEKAIDQDMKDKIYDGLKRRIFYHEPMAYIVGNKEFYGYEFKVSASTLIPRPETEHLVETALQCITSLADTTPITILDLGTGSGCIILSILLETHHNIHGIALEIDPDALAIARTNAQTLDVDNVLFFQSHWDDILHHKDLPQKYDIIVSNPPYISIEEVVTLEKDVKNHEPHKALFAGSDGLDAYREIAPIAKNRLNPEGVIILEIGINQEAEIIKIFSNAGLQYNASYSDLTHRTRGLVFKL